MQRAACLAQGKVQRRRFERPVAKAQRHLPLWRLRPQLERGEVVAEAGQRPLALERQRGPRLVQRGAVLVEHRDVLAEPVVPAPPSRTCVVMRSNSPAWTACSRSNSHDSMTSDSPASRSHSDSPFGVAPEGFLPMISSFRSRSPPCPSRTSGGRDVPGVPSSRRRPFTPGDAMCASYVRCSVTLHSYWSVGRRPVLPMTHGRPATHRTIANRFHRQAVARCCRWRGTFVVGTGACR